MYDQLNRVTSKSYTTPIVVGATPAVTYCYDAKVLAGCPSLGTTVGYPVGHLTSVSSTNGTTSLQTLYTNFDALGHVLSQKQVIGSNSYSFGYGYLLSGDLSSETYPSGRVFSTSYNQLNQPVTLSGVFGGATANYVTGSSYFPSGALNLRGYGNTVGRVTNLNSRLQPITDSDGLNYNYNQYLWMDNLTWLDAHNHDNGNLQSMQIYAGGPAPQGNLTSFSQTFGYDGVNRLTSASEGNNAWSQSYGFDQYGNMWMPPTANGLPAPPVGLAAPTANVYNGNNQNGNASYDAAGNLRTFAAQNLTFDAENRLTTAGSYAYLYDGDGQRVQKVGSASGPTSYVYNAFGELAAEYTGSTWTKDYVRMGGQVIATENAATTPCKTCYFSVDHLGSIRMVTDRNGNVVGRHDYAPFGQEILSGIGGRTGLYGASDSTTEKFTGKERDAESGLDYFGARYYGSALGRFTSADWSATPVAVPYANLENPQTLNLYSYVGNNPLSRPDLDGHSDYLWQKVNNFAEGNGYRTNAQVKGMSVAATAKSHEGSMDWAINGTNTSGKDVGHPQVFKPGGDKCNQFVGDTLAEAGKSRPEITDKDGKVRMPSAHELADPKVKITGLSAPEPLSDAKPGDVIAQEHGSQYGHAGIVVTQDNGSLGTASANAYYGGKVTVNDWGFRPAGGNGESSKDPAPVVRHPE